MSTFGTGTFGAGRFGDPDYVFVDGQYKRIAWKVRWDEGYEGKIGFAVPELENMRYAAPQMEQGELPTAFALNPDDLLPGRVEGGGGLGHIAAGTIIADDIQANTITGNEIQAQSITATELDVGQLSAITADLGSITAGLITLDGGETGLGGLIQSSPDDPKVTLDDRGLIKTSADASIALSIGPGESVKFGDPLIDATTTTAVDSFTSGDTTLTGNTSSLGTSWTASPLGVSSLAVDTSGTGWAYYSASTYSQAANLLDLSPLDTSQGIVLHATMGAKSLLVGPDESVIFSLYLVLEDNVGNFVTYHASGVQTQTEASLVIGSETIPIGSTFPNDLEMVVMVAANGMPKQTIDYGEGAISVTPFTSAAGKLDLTGPLTLSAHVVINPFTGSTQQSVGFDEIVAIEFDENLDRSIVWESSTTDQTASIVAQHTEDSAGLLPSGTSLDLTTHGPSTNSPPASLTLDSLDDTAAASVKAGEHSKILLASDGSSSFQDNIPYVDRWQLPSSPYNGQRCSFEYVDYLGRLFVWDLIWNQSAHDHNGYGWIVVGGPEIWAQEYDSLTVTSSTSGWDELDFGRPFFPGFPRPGIYSVRHADFIDMRAGCIDAQRILVNGTFGTSVGTSVRGISDLGRRVGSSVSATSYVDLSSHASLVSRYNVNTSGDGAHWSFRQSFLKPIALAT